TGGGSGAWRARIGLAPRHRRAVGGAPRGGDPPRPRGPLLRRDRHRTLPRARHGALATPPRAHRSQGQAGALSAMTCDETKGLLSALLDEALDAGERARVEAHLVGCPDCRRELDGLRATTGLLARVERARAPVGFVDRVMTQVRPVPWYRRLGRALFFPLSIKLPLEAGALAMVAVLGVYRRQTTPELKDAGRHDAPSASSPPPIERSAPSAPSPEAPPPARDREKETKRQALMLQRPPASSEDDTRRGARDE